VPPYPIQELRDLTRTRTQLTRELAHVQRIQKTLEDANIKLVSVISDIMGMSGRRILKAILLAVGAQFRCPWHLCDAWREVHGAEQHDEIAPVHRNHSITSLARISSAGGSSTASALALLRLTVRSNLTARSIGRSAGGVPFKILSTKTADRA
jgi:hypothetical protein